jgi:hypothetical protein
MRERKCFFETIPNDTDIQTLFFLFTLVAKPEGKRPLGRPRRRWEDNIKMYL